MFLFCLVFAMFCARLCICALWSPAGKWLTSWLSFVLSSVSLHFPIGILGQVWYLIVPFPDLCNLTYFDLVPVCPVLDENRTLFLFMWCRCQKSGYQQHIMVAQTNKWTCGMLKYRTLVRGEKQVKSSPCRVGRQFI